MRNYMEPKGATRWEQREAMRKPEQTNYLMNQSQEHEEQGLSLYDVAVQIDAMAQLVAYQNRKDAENTMFAMHCAAALAEQEARYNREFPNREEEFRKYLRDYVIRSSGRIGGERW